MVDACLWNPSQFERFGTFSFVAPVPQGVWDDVNNDQFESPTLGYLDAIPLATPEGGPGVWSDGSIKRGLFYAFVGDLGGRELREFTFDKAGAPVAEPTFVLDTDIQQQVGDWVNSQTGSLGWDVQIDIDPGTGRSAPQSILTDGTITQLKDTPRVKGFLWQVRSGDDKWIHNFYIEFRSLGLSAYWQYMGAYSDRSDSLILDNVTAITITVNQARVWFENRNAKVILETGTFGSNTTTVLDARRILDGQAVACEGQMTFVDPAVTQLNAGRASTLLATYDFNNSVLGIGDFYQSLTNGPFGYTPNLPEQFTSRATARTASLAVGEDYRGRSIPSGDTHYWDPIQEGFQPRRPGDRREFGISTYHEVTVGFHPDLLFAIKRGRAQEACRPIFHYEQDGTICNLDNHPNLGIWDCRPFIRENDPLDCIPDEPFRSTMDNLSKDDFVPLSPPPGPGNANGCNTESTRPSNANGQWAGYDRQHYQCSNVYYSFMFNGDWLSGHLVDHHRQLLRGTLRELAYNTINETIGEYESDRAEGRPLLTASWIQDLSPEAGLATQIGLRINTSLGVTGLDESLVFNGALGVGFQSIQDCIENAAAYYKITESDDTTIARPFTNDRTVLYWQRGIFMAGLMATFRAFGLARAKELALILAKDTIRSGFYIDTQRRTGSGYYGHFQGLFASYGGNSLSRIPENELPPARLYNLAGGRALEGEGEKTPNGNSLFRVYTDGDQWMFPAAILSRELLIEEGVETELIDKANAICRGYFVSYWQPTAGANQWADREGPHLLDWTTCGPDPLSINYANGPGQGGSGTGGTTLPQPEPNVEPINSTFVGLNGQVIPGVFGQNPQQPGNGTNTSSGITNPQQVEPSRQVNYEPASGETPPVAPPVGVQPDISFQSTDRERSIATRRRRAGKEPSQ